MVPGWLFVTVYLTAGILFSTVYFRDHPSHKSIWLSMFIVLAWFPVAIIALIMLIIKGGEEWK